MPTYKTFKRSCRNWREFASARRITVDTGLSAEEALRQCDRFNESRTDAQILRGTKMEFTSED